MGILTGMIIFRAMQLFYSTEIFETHLLLEGEEARHVQVLRKQPGDTLQVVDGQGTLMLARIASLEKKRVLLDILERQEAFGKPAFRLGIAIAPTKNISRFEWFLEKTTEIGITDIYPLLCEHSERKHLRPDRLEKILVAAMKQSVKAYLPTLHALQEMPDFLAKVSSEWSQKLVAHCEDSEKKGIPQIYQAGSDVLILIGPEGDFSSEEIAAAIDTGFQPVHLGPHRLRTETAGVVACHTIQLLQQMTNEA